LAIPRVAVGYHVRCLRRKRGGPLSA